MLEADIRGTTQIDIIKNAHSFHIPSYMPCCVTGRVPGNSYCGSELPSKVHSSGNSCCNPTICSSLIILLILTTTLSHRFITI